MNSTQHPTTAPALYFSQDDFQLRAIIRDDEPWFVGADVCASLDLGNVTNALKRLDDDEVALISIKGFARGNDLVNLVSEPGLYSLIMGSRKPEAKAFKRWVTHEVLPSIRKTKSWRIMTGLIHTRTPAEDDAEQAEFTLIDAEAAYSGVSALVELLSACPPGQQVTGIFIRSLLVDVKMHLDNVVDGLRVGSNQGGGV